MPLEGKRSRINTIKGKSKALSQFYAITKSFATIYYTRFHKDKSRSLFPAVEIHANGFVVSMYDVEADIMLAMNYGWTSVNFVVLWAVLNYAIFLVPKVPGISLKFTKPGRVLYSKDMEMHFMAHLNDVICPLTVMPPVQEYLSLFIDTSSSTSQ